MDMAHHALPARFAASESSSACSKGEVAPKTNVLKKPASKRKATEESPESDADHRPLGGTDPSDDDEADGTSGGLLGDTDDDGVPKDLKVAKKPATAAKKRPAAKQSRKKKEPNKSIKTYWTANLHSWYRKTFTYK